MPFIFLRKPNEEQEKRVVDEGLKRGFNHGHVRKTINAPPLPAALSKLGWHEVRERIKLGYGRSTFDAAKRTVRKWGHFQLGWTYVRELTPIKEGSGVCVVAHPLLAWLANPLKVVYVEKKKTSFMDENVTNGNKRTFSFGASTLKGHVLAGEERFRVEWNTDDSVWYEIYSFSRPCHILSILGYPVVRYLQHRFAQESMKLMLEAIQKPSQ